MRAAAATLALLSSVIAPMASPARAAEVPAPIRVFDAGELTLARYTVVKRLWTGSWRASFGVPVDDDAGAAIATLTAEAASVGANAIINLHCLNDSRGWPAGYYCYGLAIKLK